MVATLVFGGAWLTRESAGPVERAQPKPTAGDPRAESTIPVTPTRIVRTRVGASHTERITVEAEDGGAVTIGGVTTDSEAIAAAVGAGGVVDVTLTPQGGRSISGAVRIEVTLPVAASLTVPVFALVRP